GGKIGAEDGAELLVAREHRLKRLIDQHGIDVRMVEPLRQPVADRILETVMAQHGGVDEAAERRLGRHRRLSLLADLRPYGIVCTDLACGGGSRLGGHLPLLLYCRGGSGSRRSGQTGVQTWSRFVNVYDGRRNSLQSGCPRGEVRC